MDAEDRDWKARFAALPRAGAAGSCPRAEALSTWARGALPEEATAHLAVCPACREELIEVRRQLDAKPSTASVRTNLRARLYALAPARRIPWGWIAAAAAVVLAILGTILFRNPEATPIPKPIVVQPKEKPPVAPTPEVRPEPPRTAVKPEPPVVLPPTPEKPPAPPIPAPTKEAPVVVKPTPEPEKPAPVPDKPAPALTRAKLRGSVTSVAGSVSAQIDTDAWQPLKVAQARDFTGFVKLKADTAANKLRVGAHTCYLQRGAELALTLEEGRTHVKLSHGEAFFDVAPGPFEVESALGTVSVKGTRFLVSETDVLVQRGTVQLNGVTVPAAAKADLAKRLAWVRALEETIRIEADQMALAGGMAILPDPAATGGRAIGAGKAGQDAVAEIAAKRKQPAPYAVWIRLHWAHGVPSALTMSLGDWTWSSKQVTASPNWQWVRAGSTELPDGTFRVKLTDPQPGMRIDQILLTTDSEFNPESK